MKRRPSPEHAASQPEAAATRTLFAGGASIALAAAIVYHNSFAGPFVFDDLLSIAGNATIRDLWPLTGPLSPPTAGGATVAGRPLLNLSFAFNYALGGTAVWGYHLLNLVLHALAGLALFGVARRTLLQPALAARFASGSAGLATTLALVWTVHPLQTESVTYVVQRAESLCGLMYLLTLYGFVRGSTTDAKPWLWFSVASCFLGMASKEVMVSAPLIVLLYDRTFVAGGFGAAWRRRWRYYIGLALSWVLLAGLVLGVHGRGGSAGFGTGVSWWSYALTQCHALALYLRLALWPHPLVFDYGTALVARPADVAPEAVLVVSLVLATLVALQRRPLLGFLGAWFLALLAPSSSVVPVATQTVAEHRMYLALAAVVALIVIMVPARLGRLRLVAYAALVLACGALAIARNEQYRSAVSLWGDTVAKRPDNARARNALALALAGAGRLAEAVDQLEQAARLAPDAPEVHNNLANRLAEAGRLPEALAHIDEALRLAPGLAEAHDSKGHILALLGRWPEARESYERALALMPDLAEAHMHLGQALLELGRASEARPHLLEALRLDPDSGQARASLTQVDERLAERRD